jgi:hypothetical protein
MRTGLAILITLIAVLIVFVAIALWPNRPMCPSGQIAVMADGKWHCTQRGI